MERSGDTPATGRYNRGRILARQPMTVPSQRPIDYAYFFPWVRLFWLFRVATDPRKLVLAALGLTLLWCGDAVISKLPFASSQQATAAPPWNRTTPTVLFRRSTMPPADAPAVARHARSVFDRLTEPMRPLLSMGAMLARGPVSWSEAATLWTRLFWTLAVWSIFGGAIARLAALEIARDERGGFLASLRFAVARFVSLFSAPLLPIAGILILYGMCSVGGLVGRITFAGPWVVAAAWGLFVVLASLILLTALALAVGWPLMVAAVATENSDAFDGFSRAFNFLYSRPWLAIWCGLVSIGIGMMLVCLVDSAAVLVESIAERAVASGTGDEAMQRLLAQPPRYFAMPHDRPEATSNAAWLAGSWLAALATIAISFAASYFWSAATMVYFILRRADDGTEFDDVWLGGSEDDDDLLPLAGIASGDLPVIERPHHPTVATPSGD